MDNLSSVEAEQSVLAYLLDDPSMAESLLEGLSMATFSSSECRAVFHAASNLLARGIPPDVLNVVAEIKNTNPYFDTNFIYELAARSPLRYQAEAQKLWLEDYDRRRQFLLLPELIREAATDLTKPYDEVFAPVLAKANLLVSRKGDKKTFNEAFNSLLERMESNLPKLPTGFPLLDEEIIGLEAHTMTILAGATGTGKTTFALSMAMNIAVQGFRVNYYSLEMPSEDLVQRTISMLYPGISYRSLLARELDANTKSQLDLIKGKIPPVSINFNSAEHTIDGILADCKSTKDLNLVIIDHLQLLDGSIEYESLAATTAKIKQFCLKEKIPFVVLSQLNNDSQKRTGQNPKETDLRGSGTIAQDADVILALFKKSDNARETYLKILKNRKAPTNERVYFSTALDIDTRCYSLDAKIPDPTIDPEDDDEDSKPKRTFKKKGKGNYSPED